MKITKLEHACLIIDDGVNLFVIDPGEFTTLPKFDRDITTIVVTHLHADHFGLKNIQDLAAKYPDAELYTTSDAAELMSDIHLNKVIIRTDTDVEINGKTVKFYHQPHAIIYQSSPCEDLGFGYEGKFYYPGDSFRIPEGETYEYVACPLGGPWHKVSEAIDFCKAVDSHNFFNVHDATLSEPGHTFNTHWMTTTLAEVNKTWTDLKPGQSIEL